MLKFKLFILLLCLLGFAPQSFAHKPSMIFAKAAHIDLDQAVNQVKKNRPVKVLGAKTVQIDGEAVHVIKVLTKAGHVKKVRIHSFSKKHP